MHDTSLTILCTAHLLSNKHAELSRIRKLNLQILAYYCITLTLVFLCIAYETIFVLCLIILASFFYKSVCVFVNFNSLQSKMACFVFKHILLSLLDKLMDECLRLTGFLCTVSSRIAQSLEWFNDHDLYYPLKVH
jgi:hypothetical protein